MSYDPADAIPEPQQDDDNCQCGSKEDHPEGGCDNKAYSGNSGLCMPCLFGCAP